MDQNVMNFMIAILGGGNLLLFIKFLIERRDKKKEQEEFNLKDEILKLEKNGIRTQLLLMIISMPNEKKEIMTLAQRYFSKPPEGLDGNWYMTSIFNKWLTDTQTAKPEWFKSE